MRCVAGTQLRAAAWFDCVSFLTLLRPLPLFLCTALSLQADLGKNRASSCASHLQELNSQVQVTAATAEIDEALVAEHSIVVLIDTPNSVAVA